MANLESITKNPLSQNSFFIMTHNFPKLFLNFTPIFFKYCSDCLGAGVLVVSMPSPRTGNSAVQIGSFAFSPLNHDKCKTSTNFVLFSSRNTIPNTQKLTQKLE